MTCYMVVICSYMLLYSSLRTLNNSSGIEGPHHSQVASPSLGALAFSDRISGVLLARGLRCPASGETCPRHLTRSHQFPNLTADPFWGRRLERHVRDIGQEAINFQTSMPTHSGEGVWSAMATRSGGGVWRDMSVTSGKKPSISKPRCQPTLGKASEKRFRDI